MDARGWRGVSFEARGEGSYKFIVPTTGVRDGNFYGAGFNANAKWQTVKLDFAKLTREPPAPSNAPGDGAGEDLHDVAAMFGPALQQTPAPAAWTGGDLLALVWEISRPAGQTAWLELDNVRFYR
jgi:hypothetical protein